MRKFLLLVVLAFAAAAPVQAADQFLISDTPKGTMLDLSCMEALVAAGHADLAGVFSFVSDKDASAAFADFTVHDRIALKKYIGKLQRDFKNARGISVWDHSVVLRILALYGSPLAQVVEKPSESLFKILTELSLAPTMTLEELAARRKK